jgi:hypothetical protein
MVVSWAGSPSRGNLSEKMKYRMFQNDIVCCISFYAFSHGILAMIELENFFRYTCLS